MNDIMRNIFTVLHFSELSKNSCFDNLLKCYRVQWSMLGLKAENFQQCLQDLLHRNTAAHRCFGDSVLTCRESSMWKSSSPDKRNKSPGSDNQVPADICKVASFLLNTVQLTVKRMALGTDVPWASNYCLSYLCLKTARGRRSNCDEQTKNNLQKKLDVSFPLSFRFY